MSWESYVEHLMVDLPNGGKLTTAGLVGQDGGVWAAAPDFPAVTPEQVTAIMAGFASLEKDGHAGELGGTGIRLGDEKFQVAPGDETVIRGKSAGGAAARHPCAAGCGLSRRHHPAHRGRHRHGARHHADA